MLVHASAVEETNAARYELGEKGTEVAKREDVLKRWMPTVFKKFTERGTMYAMETWKKWERSKSGSFGKTVYDIAQQLLERVDPDEDVLKKIPNKANGDENALVLTSCEVVYPKSMSIEEVRESIDQVLRNGRKKARRTIYFNLVAAPFTLPLFLTPVSNFPIYWFLYRAHSAWMGYKGAESARKLLKPRFEQPELIAEDDWEIHKAMKFACTRLEKREKEEEEVEACCRISVHDESNCAVTFSPCDKLDDVIFSSRFSSANNGKKVLNFWKRLTAETMKQMRATGTASDDDSSKENKNRLPEILEHVEKVTGTSGLVTLHERYERFEAGKNRKISFWWW